MLSFKNETFKILQIADTQEGKKISPDTLDLINASLDREEPDLVVYSQNRAEKEKFRLQSASETMTGRLAYQTRSNLKFIRNSITS